MQHRIDFRIVPKIFFGLFLVDTYKMRTFAADFENINNN